MELRMKEVKKKILIVDDEEDLTWSLSRKLSRDDSWEILCANSGNRALEILSTSSVDLILTDLRMPGLNGIQLLNEIRTKFPLMNVIVMTAYGSAEVHQAIQRWNGTEYIEKPFEIDELRTLVTKLLDRNGNKLEMVTKHDG